MHDIEILKGATMIFAHQENHYFQKQGKIHIFQNQLQNPHKCAETMNKSRVWGKFHS